MKKGSKKKIVAIASIISAPLATTIVVAPITAGAMNLQSNQANEKISLSTLFSNPNLNVGTFIEMPNKQALLSQMKVAVPTFRNESIEGFTTTVEPNVGSLYTFKIAATNKCPYYKDDVSLKFTYQPPVGNYDLKSFFGNASDYNLTTTTTSGNAACLPATMPTNPLSLLAGMHDSNSKTINLNQLKVKTVPHFVSTLDCYEFTIEPVANSYFYNDDTPTYTIRFNVARTQVTHTNLENYINNDYTYMPSAEGDSDALGYTLGINNSSNPIISGINAQTDTIFTGENLTTNTPKFSLTNNTTYTTKKYTLNSSGYVITNEPYELSIELQSRTKLSDKITGIAPTGANKNDFLKFTSGMPTQDDIKGAITVGGNAGNPFPSGAELIGEDITIGTISGTAGSGTVTLSAKPSSSDYHNLNYDESNDSKVTIQFTYPTS